MILGSNSGITDSQVESGGNSPFKPMARYTPSDYDQTRLIPVSLAHQLLQGTLEHAIPVLVEHTMDLSIFDCRYQNDETGCTAYDPKIRLKVVLFAYSRGFVGSRRIEWLCRNTVTCMALACMQQPDHRMIADFVSSMQDEMLSLFCDMLLGCEEQQLLGGTVFALDGLKLSSNASKEWSGTLTELQHKQEKLEAKIAQLLAEHQQADGRESRSDSQQAPLTPESHDAPPQDAESQEAEPREGEPPSRMVTTRISSLRKSKSTGKKRTRKGPKRPRQQRQQQKRGRRLQRLQRQAARLKTWLATHGPKIGRQGKEIQSKLTDQESAKMPTSHGVMQG
jgi:transposase